MPVTEITSHSFEWRISLEKAQEKEGSLSRIEPVAMGFKTQHKTTAGVDL
jgi:hypothetical protein